MGSYAGVDWASEKHDVRVADAAGEKLLAATFAHDEQGLRSLCRQLVRLEVELVAIERPDGLLVERLLDAGLRVLALHPNQVAAARDRFRVSGGKSDGFDAFVLCELARTDNHRFRVLEPDSDQTKALRALTRGREDLVGMRTALTNQLRAELERFWPGPLGLFTDLHGRISLAFLERYPSPADARGLGEARLAGFLARERYSGRQKPAELLAKLRRAAAARVGELELSTRRQLVLGLVAMIKSLGAQIKGVSEEPCKRGRKDQPCLRELTAEAVKKKKMLLSARSEATSAPWSGERCFPGCRAVLGSIRSRWKSATSCSTRCSQGRGPLRRSRARTGCWGS